MKLISLCAHHLYRVFPSTPPQQASFRSHHCSIKASNVSFPTNLLLIQESKTFPAQAPPPNHFPIQGQKKSETSSCAQSGVGGGGIMSLKKPPRAFSMAMCCTIIFLIASTLSPVSVISNLIYYTQSLTLATSTEPALIAVTISLYCLDIAIFMSCYRPLIDLLTSVDTLLMVPNQPESSSSSSAGLAMIINTFFSSFVSVRGSDGA